MAACTSIAKLTRFVVRIKDNCYPASGSAVLPAAGQVFTNCIKVTGLSLGEEGTVTVPQWGVNGLLADGQRTLSPLALDFRIEDDIVASYVAATAKPTDMLVEMFAKRSDHKYDIEVSICDRGFKAIMIYKFKECDMRFFKSDDQELGAAKLGTIMTEFLPLDVELYPCNTATTTPRVGGRGKSDGSFISC